jgi:hypothetical protein
MKNIKEITLLAFAVIGFYTIITAFTSTESNQPQQVVNGTPESHVWEMGISGGTNSTAFSINKITGEVRKFNSGMDKATKDPDYVVMKEKKYKD